MLGSSASISGANTVLNTAVAEILKQFADTLECADDFETALHDLIKRVITEHKRIIFNGNGYDDKWLAEAKKRGLHNLATTPEALAHYLDDKNVELFTSHKVYTEKEMISRHEILTESYCKLINIEARTMADIARKDILPAVSEYSRKLCQTLLAKKSVCKKLDCSYEGEMIGKISALTNSAYKNVKALENALSDASKITNVHELSFYYKDVVLTIMEKLRAAADTLETLVSAEAWPFPTYGELLFGV